MTDADYTHQADEDYDYDAAGNRSGGGYSVDQYNRLLTDGTYRYAYDPEGNRTLRYVDADLSGSFTTGDTQVTEYTWDHRNRLVAVTEYDDYADYLGETPSQTVAYAYDYLNRLTARTADLDGSGTAESPETEYFVHDGRGVKKSKRSSNRRALERRGSSLPRRQAVLDTFGTRQISAAKLSF